jgi:hypothetical protein
MNAEHAKRLSACYIYHRRKHGIALISGVFCKAQLNVLINISKRSKQILLALCGALLGT